MGAVFGAHVVGCIRNQANYGTPSHPVLGSSKQQTTPIHAYIKATFEQLCNSGTMQLGCVILPNSLEAVPKLLAHTPRPWSRCTGKATNCSIVLERSPISDEHSELTNQWVERVMEEVLDGNELFARNLHALSQLLQSGNLHKIKHQHQAGITARIDVVLNQSFGAGRAYPSTRQPKDRSLT